MPTALKVRFIVAVPVLGAVYYFLLVYLIGYSSAIPRPSAWIPAFPAQHIAAIVWLVFLHTLAVLGAALPIAVASILIARERAAQLGICVAALATAVGIDPSLSPTIWPLVWDNHPVFFITDNLKLIAAVPLLAWAIRKVPSDYRLERP
jgi:hypothetical protein